VEIVHVRHLIVKAATDHVLLSIAKVEIVHAHHLTVKVATDLVLLLIAKAVIVHVHHLTVKVVTDLVQALIVKVVIVRVHHLIVVKTNLGEEMKIKKAEKIVQDSVVLAVITVDHLFLEKVKMVDHVVLDSHRMIADLRDLHVRFAEEAMIMIQMLNIAKRKELNIRNSSLILMNQSV